jgi:ABC-type transport system involved in cytochrome c biogenesis ATPase subunit
MIITKQQLAVNLLNYLQHKTSLEELVAWAENAFMEGEIQDEDSDTIRDILARLGLADVKTFGLYWEDCDNMMKKLGYNLKIDAGLVA